MKLTLFGTIVFLFFAFPTNAAQPSISSRSGMIKEKITEKKDAIKERRETTQQERKEKLATYKKRLATFKDTVKAERVERISTIFQTINSKRTSIMSTNLERMRSIILKLEEKVAQLEKEGKDTTQAKQAIQEAKNGIETTRIVVQTQAEKEYTMTISSENTVKTDAATMRSALHTDLQTLHTTVVATRNQLSQAISETKILLGDTKHGE